MHLAIHQRVRVCEVCNRSLFGFFAVGDIFKAQVFLANYDQAWFPNRGFLRDEVDEGHDYISIYMPGQLQLADIDTYNDHRIAMCFSLVALSSTPVVINDPGCTAKTFPDYFQRFASICD